MNLATRLLRGGYRTPYHVRKKAKLRRERLRDQKLCINGASHGAATDGVLCTRCRETHRRSA